MKQCKNCVTQEEIEALDQEYSVTADTTIPVDPYKLRLIARSNPDQICFPVIRTGGRRGIPAGAFSGFGIGKRK